MSESTELNCPHLRNLCDANDVLRRIENRVLTNRLSQSIAWLRDRYAFHPRLWFTTPSVEQWQRFSALRLDEETFFEQALRAIESERELPACDCGHTVLVEAD